MKRTASLLIVGLFCMLSSSAQTVVGQPPAGARSRPLQGEEKLKWICDRLDLDAKQNQQVTALLALYNANLEEAAQDKIALLRRMQELIADRDAAVADGDDQRARDIQAKIKAMAPEAAAENQFFGDLDQVLTDVQKAKLPGLRKEVETARKELPPRRVTPPPAPPAPPVEPAGPVAPMLRPIHVLKAVRSLGLSLEQETQLEKALEEYRSRMRIDPPKLDADFAARVDTLIKSIRPILNGEQGAQFDLQLATLRREPPAPVPFVRRAGVAPGGPQITPEQLHEMVEKAKANQAAKKASE